MSSTTLADSPSERIQSANSKVKEETHMEDNNATTEKTSPTQKTGEDISVDTPAAGREEPISLTAISFERPSSTADTSNELRPGSASKSTSQDITIRPSSAVKIDPTPDTTSIEPKTSRPPSANQKIDELASHGYIISSTNSRPPSATEKSNESTAHNQVTTSNSRPPSASQKTNNATTTSNSRPSSARQKVDESLVNGLTANVPISSRPSSASQQTNESNLRPSSAKQTTDESVTNGSTTTSSRPPSATLKTDKLTTHEHTISSTNSRPPSASQNVDESATNNSTTAPTSSRPPSANQKSNELNTDSPVIPPISSRPSSADTKTDITTLSDTVNNIIPAPTNSRASSANQKTNGSTSARPSSRPSTANRQQEEPVSNDSTTEQQNTSVLFNSNDPNTTQPIIGRPSSAARNEEPNTITTLNSLTENAPSSDKINSVETTQTQQQ